MAAKVYPLAVYTADHGLAWTYPRGEIAFAELDACRTAFGPLPDFDAGDKGFEGVWAKGDKVFVLRCQSVPAWDFRGRDATYLAVTWMDRAEAASTNFERLIDAEALRVPSKNPPPFFEIDAETNECPTVADPDPLLKDGFVRAGTIIAGQPTDAVVAIKRTEGSRLVSCTVRRAPQEAFAPFAGPGDSAFEDATPAPPPARPDLSAVVAALSVALFLTLALATAFGFKWWQTEKELNKAKVELRLLQEEREGGCVPWRLINSWPFQVFSGDASRPNLTPMVGALATAPLLRASQPLPRNSHTEMFKTASAMPRDTIQYAHKSKTSSTLAVESE